jgi:chromate transport protein ChrA
MFLPAFVFAALSSALLPRLRSSPGARAFLSGVNAAAVALIGVVLVTLARAALTGPAAIAIAIGAAIAVFGAQINSALVLGVAAVAGAVLALL